MDIIIVGGGLAGLYTAYNLLKVNKKFNITILESGTRLGGRINTKKINSIPPLHYEAGGEYFLSYHQNLIQLLNDLNIKYKKINLPSHIIKLNSKNFSIKKLSISDNIINLIELLNIYIEKYNYDNLEFMKSINIYDLASKLSSEFNKYNNLQNNLNIESIYSDLIFNMNSFDALKYLFNEYIVSNFSNVENYIVDNNDHSFGTSEIITKLQDFILKNKKNKIIMSSNVLYINTQLNNLSKLTVGLDNGTEYNADHIIVTCPKNNIKKICFINLSPTEELKFYNIINSVVTIPIIKIFVHIEDIFLNINFVIDSPLKIITNNTKNILMMTCDSHNALLLKAMHNRGELLNFIKNFIKKINPNIIINNIFIDWWDIGTHVWDLNINSENISKIIINPFTNSNIYFCGESYSHNNQTWMEGALETSKLVTDVLVKKYNL